MKKQICTIGLTLLTAGCGLFPYNGTSYSTSVRPTPSVMIPAISMGDVTSELEKQLVDIIGRSARPIFPVKAGVLITNDETGLLKSDDFKTALDDFRTKMVDPTLISDIYMIPTSQLQSNNSVDSIRKLGASFQSGIIFITSIKYEQKRDPEMSLNFWDSLIGNKWYTYVSTKIETLCLDVNSGIFLFTDDVIEKSQTMLLDKTDLNYANASYKLKKESSLKALDTLRTKLLSNLKTIKAKVDSIPIATPSASPLPGPSASK